MERLFHARTAAATARAIFLLALPPCLSVLVYLNALHNPFVYDDRRTILDNASIWNLWDVRDIVLHDVSRPIINLSYALDRTVWGLRPIGFHLTSVILHALNVLLLARFVKHLADDRLPAPDASVGGLLAPSSAAFAAAALFAVHPMMTEAVGYVSGRSEVLCASFFLTALLCVRRWMRGGGAWWLGGVFALWAAALATKEIAVMFPPVVFCYDRLVLSPDPAERRRRMWRLHVPLLTVTVSAALLRLVVFVALEHPGDIHVRWLALVDELIVIARYARLLVVPVGQSIFHSVRPVSSLAEPRALLVETLAAVAIAAAWLARRSDGAITMGASWFVLLLAPSSLLVVLGQGEGMAEHRVYLASCGLFIAIVFAIRSGVALLLPERASRERLAYVAFGIILLSFSARTVLRNAVWADPVRLWQEAVSRAPDEWLPQTVLGESLYDAGRRKEAADQFQVAVRLRPDEESGYMKLAMTLAELHRFDEANATFEPLRARNPKSTTVTTGLGAIAMIAGRPDRARPFFLETLAQEPNDVTARAWMAVLAEDIDSNPREALRLCEEIERLDPGKRTTRDCIHRNESRLAEQTDTHRSPAP